MIFLDEQTVGVFEILEKLHFIFARDEFARNVVGNPHVRCAVDDAFDHSGGGSQGKINADVGMFD